MNLRRNEPCFCGSGKRYKNCHGALPDNRFAQDDATGNQVAHHGGTAAGGVDSGEKFAYARQLHEHGQLDSATEQYEAVLRETPDHFDALCGLGVLQAQRKDLQAAERLLRQALRIKADSEEASFNLAAVLCDLGRAEESLSFFDKALAANPDSADVLNNRGCALAQLGRHSQALVDFRRAADITPDAPGPLTNLGNCLNAVGDYESALECFDRSLRGDATQVGALVGRSNVLSKLKKYPAACASADAALRISPNSTKALNNRGIALRGLRRLDEALLSYERALGLEPDYVDALNNRGNALQDLKRHDEALASFDRALALKPDYAGAHNNRGNVLQHLMRHEEALASYERALALKPDFLDALFGRGNALRDLKRRDEALASYERVLALDPDNADVRVNAALCWLQSGDFVRGWRDYEWRWCSEYLGLIKLSFEQPAWNGSRLDGTLLAWGEQGLGDQILYLSMLPQLAAYARRLIVAVERRLVPLVQRSFPGVEVVALSEVAARKDFDVQVPLGSIGAHLRQRWEDFPRRAYLQVDPVRSRQFRDRLASTGQLVCGLSWFSTNVMVGTHKSMRLADLLPVLGIPGVQFVDLQYGDTRAERAALQSESGIELAHVESVDNLNDIDALAALTDACDLVISVSNTNAHLAGALGKPVFSMVSFAQGRFWYWHEGREDSPWYPGVRIFRQPADGDWASVIDRVARALRAELGGVGGQAAD